MKIVFSLCFALLVTLNADGLFNLDIVQIDHRTPLSKYPPITEEGIKKLYSDCNTKRVAACSELAYRYNYGDGVNIDYKKAFKTYSFMCDNLKVGCSDLAEMYEWGAGVERDFDKATKYQIMQNRLDNEKMGTTSNFYTMDGTRQNSEDLSRSIKLPKDMSVIANNCAENNAKSCYKLAEWYSMQNGGDYQAAAIHHKGCELNHVDSCISMAGSYILGQGVEINIKYAYMYYAKARMILKAECQNGNKQSCSQYSHLVHHRSNDKKCKICGLDAHTGESLHSYIESK